MKRKKFVHLTPKPSMSTTPKPILPPVETAVADPILANVMAKKQPYKVFWTQQEYEAAICAAVVRSAPAIRQRAKADVLKDAREEMEEYYKQQKERWDKETEEFWQKAKDEFKSGDENDQFLSWCRVMWAIPIKVLVEHFHWKPITEDCCCDNRQALVKFCNKCIEVSMKMVKDDNKDIRTLCREVSEAYGASFVINEEAVDE